MQSSLFDTDSSLRTVDSPAVGFAHRNADKNETRAARKQVGRNTRRIVLSALDEAGSHGLTRPEIAERTGLPLQSVCGRVVELVKEGWAFKTYRSRNDCGVLIITDRGRRALASPADRPTPYLGRSAAPPGGEE